jgi:hypothetical protein
LRRSAILRVQSRKPAIAISLLIVALGIAWLANVLKLIPGIDWFWVTGLGVSGILLLTVAGLDRFNFVVGVCLIVSSILVVLRQKGVITVNIEAPVLFTTVGVLLFLAHMLKIPASRTADAPEPDAGKPELPK